MQFSALGYFKAFEFSFLAVVRIIIACFLLTAL